MKKKKHIFVVVDNTGEFCLILVHSSLIQLSNKD